MLDTLEFQEAVPSTFLDPPKEDTAPVCLPPWLENPYRPASLWDMIQFSVDMWFWGGYALESLATDCLLKPGPGDVKLPVELSHQPVTEETRSKAIAWLEHICQECAKVGLPISAATIQELTERLMPIATNDPEWHWLRHELLGIRKMIRKEMKFKKFFYIPSEKMRFWPLQSAPYAFTEAVARAFPSTTFDVNEAGICLATSRATACVFHLMRVLESALAVLGRVFGVSLAHTNWAPAIDEIESKIRNMHKDPTWKQQPDCKEQQEFYSQAASHFGILKDAWRNYTAHARGAYTEENAALIFDNTCAFMQKLATRLHE